MNGIPDELEDSVDEGVQDGDAFLGHTTLLVCFLGDLTAEFLSTTGVVAIVSSSFFKCWLLGS